MKTLIVGGTGLISTVITHLLVQRGDDVTVYNRGTTETPLPPNAKRILGDRKNYDEFESRMAEQRFDCVIDMVCFAPEDAKSAVRAFNGRIGQYIFCSTTEVYHKKDSFYPIREDHDRKPSPSFPYGFNKCKCENTFIAAHERGDFQLTIIRPAYTYGKGSIIHTLGWGTYYLDRMRKGKPIIVHGDGTSIMATCYKDDTAAAFAGAAGNKKAFGKMYNVSGDELMSWDLFHRKVAEGMGAPDPKLVHIPSDLLRKLVPKEYLMFLNILQYSSIYDNSAAKNDLGFRYNTPWVEGVRRTVAGIDESGGFEDCDKFPFYDRIIRAWERVELEIESEFAGLPAQTGLRT